MSNGLQIFNSQLEEACNKYPNLRIKKNGEKLFLKGTIDIPNNMGEIEHSFLIEIHYKEGFPKIFPNLFEVGGDIPPLADWHKYENHRCCITVLPLEIIYCKNGITVSRFIAEYVIPYLANQCYRKLSGEYKNEFSHGIDGLIECYSEIFQTSDKRKWVEYIGYAFGYKALPIKGYEKCICGSGKKFKKCHGAIFNNLQLIGKSLVMEHLNACMK